MKKTIAVIITSALCAIQAHAETNDLDGTLRTILKRENLMPLSWERDQHSPLYRLGKNLFADEDLSGNRNISCMSCHHPLLGAGDGLPLPLGEGAKGFGLNRVRNGAEVIATHSPHLFNLGFAPNTNMFWDGRVSFDPTTKTFTTPASGLNFEDAKYTQYTSVLTSALSAQAMFPPLSRFEMRGKVGTNEIADAKRNIDVWERLTKRVTDKPSYRKLLSEAFRDISLDEINFAHLAQAIAHFEAHEFLVIDTPFDRYVSGDDSALTDAQKRGALVFFGKGKCSHCHSGMNFSDNAFHNTAIPQVSADPSAMKSSQGHYEVSGKDEDLHKFKTPGLRNVTKTAPYGHTGVFTDLRAVIEHYRSPLRSNENYAPTFKDFPYKLFIDHEETQYRLDTIDPVIGPTGIALQDEDVSDLIAFLEALSD